ncbi:hypothetical protein LA59_09455 [Vibrio harveyi]|nr:hypothetical protein LA59_09455 [Vibrio harveyi]
MDCTIYLNDRKYRICDIGEGKCTLVLSYAEGIESLHEYFSHQFLEMERIIIVDISTCWSGKVEALCERDRSELITDVRLLTDIYWLDDFEIKTDKGQDIFLGIKLLPPI